MLRRLLGRQQRRHVEAVSRGERRRHEAGVDHRHADAGAAQVEVKRLGEVLQSRFRRSVRQCIRQAPVARDAGHQADVAVPLRRQHGQHRVEQMQRAAVVDVHVQQRLSEVEVGRAHRAIVAGAIHHQVEAPAQRKNLARSGCERDAVADVQGHGMAARMRDDEPAQRIDVARRDHDHRTQCMQLLGRRAADARGRADDPHDTVAPVIDDGIQRHRITAW